jgi:hypothetical protein
MKQNKTFSQEKIKNFLIEEAELDPKEVEDMDAYTLLDEYLQYEGIIGYTDDIIDMVESAYGIIL